MTLAVTAIQNRWGSIGFFLSLHKVSEHIQQNILSLSTSLTEKRSSINKTSESWSSYICIIFAGNKLQHLNQNIKPGESKVSCNHAIKEKQGEFMTNGQAVGWPLRTVWTPAIEIPSLPQCNFNRISGYDILKFNRNKFSTDRSIRLNN